MVLFTTFAMVGICSVITYWVLAAYKHRFKVNELAKQGVPILPGWSWVFGHLLIMGRIGRDYPADASVSSIMSSELDKDVQGGAALIDLWPVNVLGLFVSSPDVASQSSTKFNFPKSKTVGRGLERITGGPDLLSMNGAEWKFWRSVFNPGFSAASMNLQIGAVADRVEEFCELMRAKAKSNEMFCLDEFTERMTMDVIIKIALDLDLGYQHADNDFARAHKMLYKWNSFWDPRVIYHPLRPFIQKRYSAVMNKLIGKRLQDIFAELRASEQDSSAGFTKQAKSGNSVAALAIKAYMEENADKSMLQRDTLDPRFIQYTNSQIRLFLFAGNDTTSATICYVYHMLAKHPEVLTKMREEHDTVFGTDTSRAGNEIREDPAILNKCTYTMGVIKETLRLFPPAGESRSSTPTGIVSNDFGVPIPVEGCDVLNMHHSIHTNPSIWPRAREFLPERWLVPQGHELHCDNPHAYRPFEQGPRICIGQTLVHNELRAVLAMTVRSMYITPAYEEFDAKKEENLGWFEKRKRAMGLGTNEIKVMNGERAYQTDDPGAHPADKYPCRITLTGR